MANGKGIRSPEELFRKAVGANSFISTFILGHLWVEYLLVQIVKVASPKLGEFSEGLNHAKLIELVEGLGLLNKHEVETLTLINKMRNKLAHNIAYEPSIQEYKNLVSNAKKSFSDMTDGLQQSLDELDGKNKLEECEEYIFSELFMQIAYDLESIYTAHGGEIDSFTE
jgi:hypothetical protein